MNNAKALYTGLFLDMTSRVAVVKVFSTLGIDLHSNIIARHLTLKFKPTPAEVKALPIGSTVSFQATGYAADKKAQTLLCRVPNDLLCTNVNPHVTVAVAEGVKPVYSNELLARGIFILANPIDLTARVGYSYGQYHCFDFTDTIYEE